MATCSIHGKCRRRCRHEQRDLRMHGSLPVYRHSRASGDLPEPTNPTPDTTGQLNVGSLALDASGNLFFTDSAVSATTTQKSFSSNVNELVYTAGTGYAAAATVIYTTLQGPSSVWSGDRWRCSRSERYGLCPSSEHDRHPGVPEDQRSIQQCHVLPGVHADR